MAISIFVFIISKSKFSEISFSLWFGGVGVESGILSLEKLDFEGRHFYYFYKLGYYLFYIQH